MLGGKHSRVDPEPKMNGTILLFEEYFAASHEEAGRDE
jgi:hypothetical protein